MDCALELWFVSVFFGKALDVSFIVVGEMHVFDLGLCENPVDALESAFHP